MQSIEKLVKTLLMLAYLVLYSCPAHCTMRTAPASYWNMRTVEQFIRSKKGVDLASCEDALVVTNDFVGVVDGATSVTGRRWTKAQITGGQWASRILSDGIKNLPPQCSARHLIDELTGCIQAAYRSEDNVLELVEKDPAERATASVIVYSKHLNKLICVGDCQAALIGRSGKIFHVIQPVKHNDEVMSQARSMFLQLELSRGTTLEELRSGNDVGREFIEPLRKGQRLFQNNPKSHPLYQYWVLDGFSVSDNGIKVHDVPRRTRQIVLASDGYPRLYSNLRETESALQSLLECDPLLMDLYRSTKGVELGAESFDDRTYLRIEVRRNMNPFHALSSVLIESWSLLLLFRRNLCGSISQCKGDDRSG